MANPEIATARSNGESATPPAQFTAGAPAQPSKCPTDSTTWRQMDRSGVQGQKGRAVTISFHRSIVRLLLAALNSRWLNPTPCEYGFIGNVEAFSLSNLESEEKQRPGITVKTIIAEARTFKSCALGKSGLLVIDGGEAREATVWDLHELRQSMRGPEDAPIA